MLPLSSSLSLIKLVTGWFRTLSFAILNRANYSPGCFLCPGPGLSIGQREAECGSSPQVGLHSGRDGHSVDSGLHLCHALPYQCLTSVRWSVTVLSVGRGLGLAELVDPEGRGACQELGAPSLLQPVDASH